jgi:hypothetical protein
LVLCVFVVLYPKGHVRAVVSLPLISARRTPSMNKCLLSRPEAEVHCSGAAHICRRDRCSFGFVVGTFRKVKR